MPDHASFTLARNPLSSKVKMIFTFENQFGSVPSAALRHPVSGPVWLPWQCFPGPCDGPSLAPNTTVAYREKTVGSQEILLLRKGLGLSRAEFARFLGVSEATVVRWESKEAVTEPRGLQAVLLQAVADATANRPPREIAQALRSCGLNHLAALKTVLGAAETVKS
jgi:hypothetical protein